MIWWNTYTWNFDVISRHCCIVGRVLFWRTFAKKCSHTSDPPLLWFIHLGLSSFKYVQLNPTIPDINHWRSSYVWRVMNSGVNPFTCSFHSSNRCNTENSSIMCLCWGQLMHSTPQSKQALQILAKLSVFSKTSNHCLPFLYVLSVLFAEIFDRSYHD